MIPSWTLVAVVKVRPEAEAQITSGRSGRVEVEVSPNSSIFLSAIEPSSQDVLVRATAIYFLNGWGEVEKRSFRCLFCGGVFEERSSLNTHYFEAHAAAFSDEELPLPDSYADLTTCHIVLNVLRDSRRAIAEMARVTKQ